jgi:LuxR family maltose regulon positive regulatory protein
LTTDEGDNDPTRFLSYLAAGLQKIDAALGQRLLGAIPYGSVPAWNDVLPAYVNELAALRAPILLVLDDYHTITAQPVHDIVGWLIEHAPLNLHLVLASRVDPPLQLARLRARGSVVELHHQDLRFDRGEAYEFLTEVMGLPLDVPQSAALHERTEGWITGLQMAAVCLQGRSNQADMAAFVRAFTGTNRQIMDYLSEEVYRRLPDDVCSFLLRTSILERFNASLCSVMMGADIPLSGDPTQVDVAEPPRAVAEAQMMLERLERANLFLVPLDDERKWYRYHHLFAALLHHRRSTCEQAYGTSSSSCSARQSTML